MGNPPLDPDVADNLAQLVFRPSGHCKTLRLKRQCSATYERFRENRSLAVLFVADLFHPVDVLAVERFRNRNMRHAGRRCRTMPVLLAGRKPNDVAGMDFFDRSALALRPAKTAGDDRRLTERMGVPH